MSIRNARWIAVSAALVAAAVPGFSQIYSGQYAVILRDTPVAQRFGSREAMSAPAADAYRRQIVSAQDAVRHEMDARKIPVVATVDTVLNAMFVAATADRVAEMKQIPGVLEVVPLRKVKALLNRATQIMNAPAAWAALGGQGSAGAGMKVAVLDFGIDQTHPAFQDPSLTMPAGFPKCTDGHPEDCAFTTNKVIVARSYVRLIAPGSNPSNPAADSRPDDFSPRDHEGHGTAIASVIAGNNATGSVTITGMAPKAYLGSYKIFGSPGVNEAPPESVIIKAADDAVKDGMDVISLSAGFSGPQTGPLDTGAACGLAAGVPCDLLATAFENDVKAGVVVVVAAGNDNYFICNTYPCFNSITSPATAPSVIAVGATTNSHYFLPTVTVAGAPSNLQNIAAQPGDDPTSPVGAYTYPVRDVTTLGDNGLACSALPASTLFGTIALIQRGTCSFATKVDNAWDAGASGVIIISTPGAPTTDRPLGLDNNGIPVAMLTQADGLNLKNYIAANPAALVTMDPAGTETDDTINSNFLVFFSSVGPNVGNFAVKPEIVAVGAGFQPSDFFRPEGGLYMAAQTYDPDGGQYSTTRYAAAEGTSFSAPLVAGAAALVKQKHPTWTPAQIKSALVNTAKQDVITDDSGNTVDVEWLGAGKLDAGAAVNTSVAVNPPTVGFGLLTSGTTPAPQQLTVTNLGSSSATLTVAVVPGATSSTGNLNPGITPTVDKSSITLAAGNSTTVTVSLAGTVPGAGAYNGAITIKGGASPLTIPYAYYVGGGAATDYSLMFIGSGGYEAIIGQQPYDALIPNRPSAIGVRLIDGNGVPVSGAAVTWSVTPRNSVTFKNSSTTTDAYGVAMTDLVVNQASSTVTVSTGGQSTTFSGTGWAQPTISAGGVVNAANNTAPIAPGSYVAIYGSNLAQFTDQNYYPILPLSLDALFGAGVTVSFDAANGSYPGRMVFISPGQVNVQVPWELQGQTSAQVKVTINDYIFGNVVSATVADATPSFFETSAGIAAAVDNGTGKVVLAAAPIKRGGIVQLYMNGLGACNNQPNSGEPASSDPNKLATTKASPTVQIGGQSAQVFYSGLAPGFPGLYQVTVSVPSGITVGTAPVTVTIGGKTATSGLPVN
jgi:uncharacterized protein (TIGR03437 family)